jgi:hypothetical protein
MTRLFYTYATALWFGAAVFMTLAGVLVFRAFDEATAGERPIWLAEAPKVAPDGFPEPRREQASRAAGVAVSALFPAYYGLQTGCALVALLAALALRRRLRIALATAGLLSVLVGWGLERKVESLRAARNGTTDAVLMTTAPTEALVAEARAARAAFGMWHGFSLIQNFVSLLLAAGLVGLTPADRGLIPNRGSA